MNLQNRGYKYTENMSDGSYLNNTEKSVKQDSGEPPLLRKMGENYKYFGGLSVIYGLIFTFCLYKNLHGITFPLCVGTTIVFSILFMKKIDFKLQKKSVPYIAGMILLGVSTAYTSSSFFHFFNMLGIILLFFVFMIHQFYNDHVWDLPGYLKRMLILFGTVVECLPCPVRYGRRYFSKNKNGRSRVVAAVGIGVSIAVGMLCIILPLLLKSDMMFSKIFGEILKYINFGTIIGVCLTFVTGTFLSYSFFAALCKYNFPEERERKLKYYHPIIGITFTGIISVIYVMYCLVQIVYLFGRLQIGLPEGVTYAQYARGGFWELLFVSFINFVMVLVCMYLFYDNMALKIILTVISGCTFIMLISAAYRMMLYIAVYHLTFLRILVLWFLVVLAFIMCGVVISMYKRSFPLFRYTVAVVSIMYIMFAFSRPDVTAIRYNLKHAQNKKSEDIMYFLYSGSIDAAPEIAKINIYEYSDSEYLRDELYQYFARISTDYDDVMFRKANYSEIRAKLAADEYLGRGSE